ncbi:protein MpABC4 [Marchantia polymorpha subsp. ruderalis]
MGTASAGLLSWHNCTVGTLQGVDDQQQIGCRIRGNSIRRNYGRSLHRLSSSGLAVRRACLAKWYGGNRDRLKEVRSERTKHGSKCNKSFDTLVLSKSWNGPGYPPVVQRRLQISTVVCNVASESGAFGNNGSVDRLVDILTPGPEAKENGSASSAGPQAESKGLFYQLRRIWQAFLSILPYGSWWNVGDRVENDKASITFISAMHRLWELISPDKLVIGTAFFALVVAALSEITIPHFVAATIFSAQGGLTDKFYKNAKLLAVMSCTYGLFSGLRGGCFGVANQILVRRMREKLFTNLLNQDIAFFDMEAVGALTSRLGSDCQQVSRIIGNDLNVMFRNGLQGLGAFIYLMTLSWQLAISTFVICSTMWCFMRFYGRYQKSTAKTAQDSVASANEVAEETLSLARVVRTFGTEKDEVARYTKWSKRLVDINLRQNVAYGFWTWSSNTLYNATQVVALLIGGGYVMTGQISAEQLTKFVLYSEWVVHSTWWVGDHWASLMQAIGASEKVFNLLDLPPSTQLVSKGRKLPEVRGRIQFNDICFQYPARPQVPVLRNVSFSIFPGELVAVVGLSGSGKSTIVGLLLRLYEPSHGQILIDGVPLNDLDIKWFRHQLGVVSQEPRLFSMDIASNISYGCSRSITTQDIEKAAKQANAHDFIMALPDGYKTIVDNVRLSGGQKQRIAIARALLRDPAILVLDEATSALDSESEHLVQKALDRAMRGDGKRKRTVLVIAHRLSTIRAAHRIVVMHQGQIAEMGSHDELIKLDGEYARLTRRQLSTLP